MNIEITCKNMTVTPSIKEHITNSFEKLQRLDATLINPHVVIEQDGKEIAVEAKILIPGGELFAKAHNESFQVAANKVVDKLKQQLSKHRGKQAARTKAA